MTVDSGSPELHVDPLPEPMAPPWDAESPEESPEAPPAEPAMTRAEVQDALAGLVQVPFAALSIVRGPHWELSDREAGLVAAPLARALPASWWMERALTLSPWGLAAAALWRAVSVRLQTDAELAARAAEDANGDTRPARGAASGPESTRRGPGAQGDATAGAGGVTNPADFEGAGLGLRPSVSAGRSTGRRTGRGPSSPGGDGIPTPG